MSGIDQKHINRLNFNLHSLNEAFHRLKDAIYTPKKEQEIYTAIGETLFWLITTDEWHKKHNSGYKQRKSKNKKGQMIYGLLHAYNSMKHNMDFFTIHKWDGGLRLPTTFPISFSINVRWIETDGILEDGHPDTVKNYQRYVENKDVFTTISQAIDFLKEESEQVNK